MPDDIFVHHDSAERQMCTGQSFRECHEIWFAGVTVELPSKPFATAAKSAHHFIGNQEYAARTCQLTQVWPVIVRRHDAICAGIWLHQDRGNRLCAFAVDFISNDRDRTLAALDFAAATKRTPIRVGRRDLRRAVTLRINLMTSPRVSGESHASIAGAVIGTIASDYPAIREATRLPRKLDRVFVCIGAGQGKKDAAVVETSLFEQSFRELRTRLRAPCGRNKT